ncbi:putative methyltransferase DDB_G0268948 [Lepisosteus oculatus]|uniref:putative methyltransferase DDB_G0268948 n=1 Tax=Lepisosteus oculatus TaxID=7918 RepID=UPI0035F525B1
MAFRLFEEKQHASVYQKFRFTPPEEVKTIILDYLDRKKEKPHVLAVDLGCGTGQNTRLLAPHFQEVVGLDISESQVAEARAVPGFSNITYRVGGAEEMPFPDSSVDLITAATAAHYFDIERFLKEAHRVLKPQGCMALLGYTDRFEFYYGNCEGRLTSIYRELVDALLPYTTKQINVANSMLQDLFEAIPYPDKERIENIILKELRPVSSVVGLCESFSMYQAYQKAEPEAARALLQTTQQRFLEEIKVSSPETEVEVRMKYFCVLASKPR